MIMHNKTVTLGFMRNVLSSNNLADLETNIVML